MKISRKQVRKALLLTPLVLVSAALVAAVVERVRGKVALARFKRTLASRKERLTPADLRRTVAADENGSPDLHAAVQALTNTDSPIEALPPLMRLTPSGSAIRGLQRTEWVSDQSGNPASNNWSAVAAKFESCRPILASVREALKKPAFDNEVDYAAGAKMPVRYLAPMKRASQCLGASALLSLRANDPAAAMDALEAQVRLLRALEEDRILISELVRIAMGAVARVYTWEALQFDGWTDMQLARLQASWESTAFLETMARCLEGERIFSIVTYDMMRESNKETVNMLFWMEDHNLLDFLNTNSASSADFLEPATEGKFLRNEVYCRAWRFCWLDQSALRSLRCIQQLLDACRAALTHKSFIRLKQEVETTLRQAEPKGGYERIRFPEAILITPVGRSVERAMRSETERSLVLAAIALKRYQLKQGRYPESLDALVPEFLPSVPVDFMAGQPLRYTPKPDNSYLLYSVGENGEDDGGDGTVLPDKPGPRNIWSRKDVLWPPAATAREIEAAETAEE